MSWHGLMVEGERTLRISKHWQTPSDWLAYCCVGPALLTKFLLGQIRTVAVPCCVVSELWPFAVAGPAFETAGLLFSDSLAFPFPLPLFLAGLGALAGSGSAPGTTVLLRGPPSLLLGFCSELRLKCPPPEEDVPVTESAAL